VSKEEKKKAKSPKEIADSYLQCFGTIKTNDDLGGKQKLVSWRDEFYVWDNGVYSVASDIDAELSGFISSIGMLSTPDLVKLVKHNLNIPTYLMKARVLNTWLTETDKDTIQVPIRAITMENGIVLFDEVSELSFTKATPDFFSVVKLPYGYKPQAECPRWIQFLAEVTRGDKATERLLQQWAGYLLLPTNEYQSFLLCIGDAGTGKGTYAHMIKKMLGETNCCAVPIRRFSDRFSMSISYGKMVNIAGDAEEEITPQAEGLIKEWTGEDLMTYERKYLPPFTASPTAKLMISANSFPAFTDKSNGTWRRLKLAFFDRENPEYMDIKLKGKLEAELPGIFNWAVRGLQDLTKQGIFVTPKHSNTMWGEFKAAANPAGVFLTENYVFKLNSVGGVATQTIYTTYRNWCRAKGYNPLSDRNFSRELKRVFKTAKRTRYQKGKKRYWAYAGVQLAVHADIINL